ncbi:nucleotidyltransferase family protein [uncultured Paraglaciecola sp.]|uniref:nucleotidyltransferase family protein n=1 Tax=uncultured Paraglaciecola sp. TaxID=1765024 RepID=UPI0025E438C0|nr:nucleotidyltransferase family protein [uncultured Paraglaciecola sp.]
MKTELIMLAAGQSKRFNGIKQLADIQGQPMICHCLSHYCQGDKWINGITNGYVVLGSNAESICKVLPANINQFVVDSWPLGMGHSLAQSIQLIANDTTHILICLADQVALNQQLILKMLEQTSRFPNHIIAASYANKVGVPAIFPRQYLSELAQMTGDNGAKSLLQKYSQQVLAVDMPEAAFDIDTIEDLNALLVKSRYVE